MIYIATPIYSNTSYLTHHGILNQKWGIRRYQNKDGTLTELGKRRAEQLRKKQAYHAARSGKYAKQEAKLTGEKSNQSKKATSDEKTDSKTTKKKSINDMTEAELRSEVNRLGLIKQYNEYMREINAKPKKTSAGKEAVKRILSQSFVNVGTDVTTSVMGISANKLGQMLGLDYDLYRKAPKRNNSNR